MHPGAFEFVGRYATNDPVTVIEIGSRDINGSVRSHFPAASWTGLDLHAGPGVDVVCDASDWAPVERAQLVICCEVLEHCEKWRGLIHAAWRFLKPGGLLLVTCAGIGRDSHSAVDGGQLRPHEWYANLTPAAIANCLEGSGFSIRIVESNQHWHDVYAAGIKVSLPDDFT